MTTLATTFSQSTGLPTLLTEKPGLLVKIHPLDGISQPLELSEASYVIGRDAACTVTLDDDAVSRRHVGHDRRV